MSYKKYFKLLFVTLVFFIGAELTLRIAFGFCDTVLFKESKNYEYIPQPNQSRHRFGSHIVYNSLSMRSKELDTSAVKILCFGDSVINGGVLTDQDSLATTLLGKEISSFYNEEVQFLNISAGSWGPDNGYAYLKEKGDLGAKLIILFVNSHDIFDIMDFEKVIDIHKSFPSYQYSLALYELWDRYLKPRFFKKSINNSITNELGINKKKEGDIINPGFKQFISYSKKYKIPLILYLHAEKSELEAGQYNEQGRQIIQLAKSYDIPLLEDLNLGLSALDFRDQIHINPNGQKKMSEIIFKEITENYSYLIK